MTFGDASLEGCFHFLAGALTPRRSRVSNCSGSGSRRSGPRGCRADAPMILVSTEAEF